MKKYPSYKDSGVDWIGEIPDGWEIIKPKNLFSPTSRKPNDNDEVITCFRDGVVTLRKNRREDGFTISLKEIGYQKILVGDLVIHEMDGFEGSIGISDSIGKSTPVYTVIPPSNNYNSRYWMFLLRVMSKTGFIESLSKSIRERTTEFRWNMWKTQSFCSPPLSEQTQIVSYLDRKTEGIDKLIQTKVRKIELLKEYRTSLISKVVTKGLNPNVKMKDSGVEWIGEIPEHWGTIKLKFQGEVIIGLSYSPDNVVDERDGTTLVMRSSNVQNGKTSFHDNVFVNSDIPDKLRTRENDILICSRNGSRNLIGKNCLIPKENEDLTWGVFMTVYRSKSPKFIYWLLNSPVFESQSGLFLTSTINQLTVSNLENMVVPFVSDINEQNQIVSYLDEQTQLIDKNIQTEERKIEILKEYRQSLISEVVTGKINVCNDEEVH